MSLYQDLSDRIASLREVVSAAQAIAEQIPAQSACAKPASQPLRFVLHVDVHPKAEFGKASAAIEQAVCALRAFGLYTQEIGVQPEGLGDALIDALRRDTALGVPVNPTQAQ